MKLATRWFYVFCKTIKVIYLRAVVMLLAGGGNVTRGRR